MYYIKAFAKLCSIQVAVLIYHHLPEINTFPLHLELHLNWL